MQYYTWKIKHLSVRIFKKLSSNKLGVCQQHHAVIMSKTVCLQLGVM